MRCCYDYGEAIGGCACACHTRRASPLDEGERLRRDIAILEGLYDLRPCYRCGHRRDYHGKTHCGVTVCQNCGNDLHNTGWCACPEYLDESWP